MAEAYRINIVGSSGSGKSTLGKALADKLKIPFGELDQFFWGPNWSETPEDEFRKNLSSFLAQDSWVLDGNYNRTRHAKWDRVTHIIWVDYSFVRTFYQSLKRALSRIFDQKELWPGTGNKETFRMTFFSKKSILWWMITNYAHNRRRYLAYSQSPQYAHIKWIRLSTPSETEKFMEGLSKYFSV